MANDTKNIADTPKQKLIDKAKKSAYNFDKINFKKFQNFFLKEFSNTNLEEVRKQAWRIR